MFDPISINLPRPVTLIHQIELTSHCNLRCVYCTSPNLQRPKLHMTRATYEKALGLAQHFLRAYCVAGFHEIAPPELNLAGIGESTLHPDLVDFVAMARMFLPAPTQIVFATNGVALTESLVKALAPYKPKIGVSLHRPEKAGPALELLKKYGLFDGAGCDAGVSAIDWAGQVDWHVSAPRMTCPWIREGWAMVMADGRITSCCLDASGAGVIGTVDDKPEDLKTQPYSLCRTCHNEILVEWYDQYGQAPSTALPVLPE